MKKLALLILGIATFALSGCGYNTMQANEEAVFAAWGDVEATYQRRADLIPNLVEVVKGYAKHEAETLQAVTEARAKVGSVQVTKEMLNDPASFTKFQQAQGELSGALSRLMVVVERYPDLKANQNFLALQEELTSTENKIGFARQFYNDTVMRYNTKIQTIPTNIVAGVGGFSQETFFEVQEAGEREAPQVKF